MLSELQWDTIHSDYAYQLRDFAEQFSEENTYHIMLIGDKDSGKTTYLNNIGGTKFKHLPTKYNDIELSLLQLGKDLVHLWKMDTNLMLLEELENRIKIIDGVIGFFDLTKQETYDSMVESISKLIRVYGKMYPLILIGNKADNLRDIEVQREDVLIFAYELGNCSCHRVPYNEMSALQNIGVEQVLNNIITMVNCNLTEKCSELPALVRQWCNIPQYYSYNDEPRQKLEVK